MTFLKHMTPEEALAHPNFSHARAKSWCRQWVIYIYHRDPESPTGVQMAAGAPDTPELEALFRKYNRPSPLSPTEPR